MRYVVTTRYHSSLCAKFGTGWLARGQEIDLMERQAAEFNVDYPGLLVPAATFVPAPEPKPAPVLDFVTDPAGLDLTAEPEVRSYEAPPQNRRVGRPPKRRDLDGG